MSKASWGRLETTRRVYYKGLSLYVDRDKDAPMPKTNRHYGAIGIQSIECKDIEEFISVIAEDLEPGDVAKLTVDFIEEETRVRHRPIKITIQPPNTFRGEDGQ